jgi:hypothetical protein
LPSLGYQVYEAARSGYLRSKKTPLLHIAILGFPDHLEMSRPFMSNTCSNYHEAFLTCLFMPCSAGWGGRGGYVYQKAYLESDIIPFSHFHCGEQGWRIALQYCTERRECCHVGWSSLARRLSSLGLVRLALNPCGLSGIGWV